MPLTLSSPAFSAGGATPETYTRDGENIAPPWNWSGIAEGARSMVLVVDDPDAPRGTFSHWAVFSIAPDADGLPELESGRKEARRHALEETDLVGTYHRT